MACDGIGFCLTRDSTIVVFFGSFKGNGSTKDRHD